MNKPKLPPNRYIKETSNKFCSCGSTLKRKGCIQPNCVHYYKGFPNKDYNPDAAIYLNDGKIDFQSDDMCLLNVIAKGLATAIEGLYEAKTASTRLGFNSTVLEIDKTISDVDEAWIKIREFISTHKKSHS